MSDGNGKMHDGAGEPVKPLIEYPTPYAFKVMGKQEGDFAQFVRELFDRLMGRALPPDAVVVLPSSKGTWVSVTVSVLLTSEAQRQDIYAKLKAEPRIVYYL